MLLSNKCFERVGAIFVFDIRLIYLYTELYIIATFEIPESNNIKHLIFHSFFHAFYLFVHSKENPKRINLWLMTVTFDALFWAQKVSYTYRSSNRMLLRLISLHIDRERGRWKNLEPRLELLPPVSAACAVDMTLSLTDITSSSGKLTLRDGLTDVVDDVSSPDIPNAL